jgi:glycosyltransferase involved in cell wall biosynthesis
MVRTSKQKRKLLIVGNNLYTFGGGENLSLEIASALKNDFDVTILSFMTPKDIRVIDRETISNRFELGNTRIVDLNCTGIKAQLFGMDPFVLKFLKPGSFGQLIDEIKSSDTVYTIGLNPLVMGWVIFFSRLYRKKFILGVHNVSIVKVLNNKSTLKARCVRSAMILVLGTARSFHVETHIEYDALRSAFPRAEITKIPNFIPGKIPHTVKNNTKEFVCLFVGRLERDQKGIDQLCDIIERTIPKEKKIKFSIVGKGGNGESMVAALSKKYKSNIKWHGFLSGKPLVEQYSDASLFLLTVKYDALYLVFLEAQAHGLPVLSFGPNPNSNMTLNTFQGTVVQNLDTKKFSEEILRYYKLWQNKNDYMKLKKKVNANAYSEYGEDKVMEKFKKLFS